MEAKTVSETRSRIVQVMTPDDANILGKVFGGRLLAMVDLAAYTTASRFAGNICVTASFDRVDFHQPIEIGEVVSLEAVVSYAGRTSVEVTIEVTAENILTGVRRHTNTAHVTTVAVKDGKPVPVPKLVCETREEKVRFLEGRLRRQLRGTKESDFERKLASIAGSSDARLDELLVSDGLL